MKFYKEKENMKNYLADVIAQLKKTPQKTLSFALLADDIQKRWYTVGDLAIKKRILWHCEQDQGLIFEQVKNERTGRSNWYLRHEQ